MKPLVCVALLAIGCHTDPGGDPAGSHAGSATAGIGAGSVPAAGRAPIDSHKDDPVMASAGAAGGMAAPAGASTARAAAHAAEAALAAAVASKATAPAALCKAGHDAVEVVEAALNAPGLAVPAAAEAAWRDQLGALLMNAGAFDGQLCAAGKPADADAIKDALVALHDRAKQLEAVAAKPD